MGVPVFSNLSDIFLMQKKVLRLIYFRRKFVHSEDLFIKTKVLTLFK